MCEDLKISETIHQSEEDRATTGEHLPPGWSLHKHMPVLADGESAWWLLRTPGEQPDFFRLHSEWEESAGVRWAAEAFHTDYVPNARLWQWGEARGLWNARTKTRRELVGILVAAYTQREP